MIARRAITARASLALVAALAAFSPIQPARASGREKAGALAEHSVLKFCRNGAYSWHWDALSWQRPRNPSGL